ncbi:MAG: hypothetical protein AAGG11_10425 [Pseudomonadota bacterium]
MFRASLKAHGGDRLALLNDVAIALDGRWKFLIRRIQPLVTDFRYRVRSEERLLLADRLYAADYRGPGGRKQVLRQPQVAPDAATLVAYDGVASRDPDVRQSTALTADSFFLFTLGPLALAEHAAAFRLLGSRRERGRDYWLLHLDLVPGLGESAADEVVLWVDQETQRTHRVQITLEGYVTTQGANVDVTFRSFTERDGFLFPSAFFERVRAPIAIDAHAWCLTGLDINRGLTLADFDGGDWSGAAERPAASPDVEGACLD